MEGVDFIDVLWILLFFFFDLCAGFNTRKFETRASNSWKGNR